MLLAVYKWLPESGHPDASISLRPGAMMRAYRDVLRQKQFVTFSFAGSIAAAALFSYIAGSPFVFMNLYGVSEQHYGWIFSIIAAGLISASQVNNLLLKHRSSAQLLRIIIPLQSAVGIVLVAGVAMHALGLYPMITLLFLFLSCQGFTFPNAASLAMAPFDKGAGSASALMGALQMAFGALCSFLVGIFFDGTALPMVVIMAVCSIISSVILLTAKRRGNH
jgi:DHA1 family bicyclomycin/chloramphenicol resistance-like MFS transporter